MFSVEWLQSAIDELAEGWLQADSDLKKLISAAIHTIEQRLRKAPHDEGESRPNNRRLTFVPPLSVSFRIEQDSKTVLVLQVRVFKKKSK